MRRKTIQRTRIFFFFFFFGGGLFSSSVASFPIFLLFALFPLLTFHSLSYLHQKHTNQIQHGKLKRLFREMGKKEAKINKIPSTIQHSKKWTCDGKTGEFLRLWRFYQNWNVKNAYIYIAFSREMYKSWKINMKCRDGVNERDSGKHLEKWVFNFFWMHTYT